VDKLLHPTRLGASASLSFSTGRFASPRTRPLNQVSLKSVMHLESLEDRFHLPLSVETFIQFCELDIILHSLQGNNEKDTWSYIWENWQYSAAKAYRHLLGSQNVHPSFRWLWRSSCQQKHKVFFWLLLQDRLNKRGLLRTKSKYLEWYSCELCLL
jgi:hypothetical protein